MRKLIFLILITLFAAYAGWAERRPVGHYLSDLRSQVSVVQGQPGERGNLLAVQPELFTPDYQSAERLQLKFHAYLENARRQGLLNERTVVLVDTHVNDEPTAEQIAEFTVMAAQEMARMNLAPKVALLSRSNFGTGSSASGAKMRRALELVREIDPELEIDGEMHGDCALDEALRMRILPSSSLKGEANLLVCPNVDAGNIAYNLLKTTAGSNVAVGPFLLGANAPVHILTSSSTVRRIVNMTAMTVVDANTPR